jgi:ABC-type multidrug transport system ATPase subunit
VTEPLLSCVDLRVDIDGAPACDGVAFTTKGDRVLVLGGPRALFLAAAGLAPVVRGSLKVLGAPPGDAVRDRTIAACSLAPALPPRWTVLEYVTWSARLSGLSKGDARARAAQALARVGLEKEGPTKLGRALPYVLRGTTLAATLATDAKIVALEDPIANLPEEAAVAHAELLVKTLAGRPWIVFASRVPLTSPLARNADEALIVTASALDAQGDPSAIAAATSRYRARVQGPVAELVRRLEERGVRAQVDGSQLAIDLAGALTTSQLLGLCAETQVAVVELVPTARALA